MKSKKTLNKSLVFLICGVIGALILCFFLQKHLQNSRYDTYAYTASDKQAAKLQKLCKVWGFAKYTHQAFLTGEKDWDEELLSLIPIVQSSDEDEINDILYNWFLELGDDGYELNWPLYRSLLIDSYGSNQEALALISEFFDEKHSSDWSSLQKLKEELLLLTGHEANLHQMADMSWINKSYLGQPLAKALSQFHEIQVAEREKAPVSLDRVSIGNSVFSNEKTYESTDYSDDNYRLLGLFRLWNAIEYYFPYMDILDDDWNELLFINISKMLNGTDKVSYELTLAALASKLHDAHVRFSDDIFDSAYGSHIAPVLLAEIEGRVVVTKEYGWRYKKSCPMKPGDILLRLNGTAIEEITTDMLQYLSYPNEDKALSYLLSYNYILRQKTDTVPMEVDVLRDGAKLSLAIDTVPNSYWSPFVSSSHMILDNNIGLINPSKVNAGEIPIIMKTFANTDGLIVDLRQYPNSSIFYELADYLLEDSLPFVIMTYPLSTIPGVFVDSYWGYTGSGENKSTEVYYYDKNVVLLMNEQTASNGEFTVMSLRGSTNVTVMGSNSIGADGNMTLLPLPGDIVMGYTGLGVYTPEGGQTQRIGLSPDIYVEPTIAGVRDGIDELMEAAIIHLLNLK